MCPKRKKFSLILACCEAAFEGAAVMADPPRSAPCVRSRPDAAEGFAAKISFRF
jgi:hypothetical protein